MLIARAKLIEKDELIEGQVEQQLHEGHVKYFIRPFQWQVNEWVNSERIDPQTLEYSSDGEIWFTIGDIDKAMQMYSVIMRMAKN